MKEMKNFFAIRITMLRYFFPHTELYLKSLTQSLNSFTASFANKTSPHRFQSLNLEIAEISKYQNQRNLDELICMRL